MNERLKELAEKARLSYVMVPGNPYAEDDLATFAKLIMDDYADSIVLEKMSDPTYAKAMDRFYENKWAHRFD